MLKNLALHGGYAAALILLGLQTLVILADFTINTLFFDELFSWLINAALAWIIRTQRKYLKEE